MATEKDALTGTENEKVGDTSADGNIPGVDDSVLDHDSSRARFISNNHEKGEVYVDVEGKTKVEDEFVGLSKEELMKFADDPKWKKIRMAFLIIFAIGWIGMLVAAIIIIIMAPKCPPKPKLDWWQVSTVYQVYPKSFKDSNADGIGDLKGLHNKLDHLTGSPESINVSAVLLSAVYPHGGTAGGYDVTDYQDISPEFGIMDDFYNLRVAMHKKGLHLILDFIPNHTSKKHPWFEKSRKKEGKYADYYVWKASPPNAWESFTGGSAWEYDNERQEYYLHQFSSDQPDLNLRNEDVRAELENIITFWLQKGVDGFRVVNADYLFECANFTNDESCRKLQPESYEIITDWRQIMDAVGKEDEKVRYLMVDSRGTVNETIQYMQHNGMPGAHAPINRELLALGKDCLAQCVYEKISLWASTAESAHLWNNWQIGDMDTSRVSSRFDRDVEMINVLAMLHLMLPGTAFTYYGEEIGMHDLDDDQATGINKYRSPMQWSPGYMYGFTDGNSTWEPMATDSNHINVMSQLAHGAGLTSLKIYGQLGNLRKEPSFQWGRLNVGVAENILFYIRQATGFPGFLVAMNLGPTRSTVDFIHSAPEGVSVPEKATVAANTGNFDGSSGEFDVGKQVALSNLLLKEKQGVIFKWDKDPNQ